MTDVPRLSRLVIVTLVLSMVKWRSTDPLVVPLRRSAAPVRSFDMPKSAKSMARRMVDFPLPMSPERSVVPSGSSSSVSG